MLDINLMMNLFRVPSQSGSEYLVSEYIQSFLNKNSISYKIDDIGNIYNISKNAPLLCAHMDTVQDNVDTYLSQHVRYYEHEQVIKGYGVIGADDKAGIYTILYLLQNGEDINFLFTVQEEAGAIGAQYFSSKMDFSSLPYGLIVDRKGSSDIICKHNDYGTDEFDHALVSVGKHFGFIPAYGLFSDCDELNKQISCANLSAGYYNPHTKQEFLRVNELHNTINFVHSFIKNIDVNYPAPENSYQKYSFFSYYDDELSSIDGVCDLCGSIEEAFKIETINKKLCTRCLTELMWEINSIAYNTSDEIVYDRDI